MLTAILIVILLFLSVQVLPVAIGINASENYARSFFLILVLSVTQVLTFWFGLKTGESFMYLMEGFKSVVVFIGFLLIGIRMLMEVFNIRKGERTYTITNVSHVALAAVAQGINSFLTGILFYYMKFDEKSMLIFLISSSLLISIGGLAMKPGKLSLAFASLLYTIGGFVMLAAAVYFSFFYL